MQKYISRMQFLFAFLTFIIFNAQKNFGKIEYESKAKDNKINYVSGTLYFDLKSSVYVFKNEQKEKTKSYTDLDGSIIRPSNSIDSIANKQRFIFFDDKIFYNNIINNNIETLLKDGTRIEWRVTKVKKKILGYNCTKAIGKLYDVDYTVYYTTLLNFPFGPLKINGLPGIILAVESDEVGLNIVANKITFEENDTKVINQIKNKYDFGTAMSSDEYNKILLQYLNEKKPAGLKKFELEDLNCKGCNSK